MDDPATESQERREGRGRGCLQGPSLERTTVKRATGLGEGSAGVNAERKRGGASKRASPSAQLLTGAKVLVQLRGASSGGAVMAGW